MRPARSLLAIAVVVAACHHGSEGSSAGAACTSSGACGGGLLCLAGKCASEAPRAASCAPPGKAQLVAGAAMQATDPGQTCVTAIRPAASTLGARVTPLGQHRVGEVLLFAVPPGTWSVTVVSQEVPGTAAAAVSYQDPASHQQFTIPNSVVPTAVRAPDGTVYYDDLATAPTDASRYPDFARLVGYYGGFTPISGALTLPNTAAGLDVVRSRGGLPDGTWQLQVNDFAAECLQVSGCTGGSTSGVYDVVVITRPGPIASTGTLDVEVYLAVPSAVPDAASALSNPHLARVFSTLSTVLANAGLCLGNVTFHDLPQWAVDRYKSLNVDKTGPCDPLSQLFTLAQADSAGVQLFLLEELTESTSSGSFQIVGIDGSIPGPSGVPGTINGGAVVPLLDFGVGTCPSGAVDVGRCGDDRIAYVLAHEMGHWLGLYHTAERTGSLFDPLDDTPRCSCSVCAPMVDRPQCAEAGPTGEPVSMIGSWCAQDAEDCGGAQNLMFWLFDDVRSRAALSREQGEVMRLNPAVH